MALPLCTICALPCDQEEVDLGALDARRMRAAAR
jgi:hypothetical protein